MPRSDTNRRTAHPDNDSVTGSLRRLNRIEFLLVARGAVTVEALAAAKNRQRGSQRPLTEVLLEQEAIDEELLVKVLSEATGMPLIEKEALAPDPSVQDLVPPETAQRLGLLPLRVIDGVLEVATGDPLQVPAFDELSQLVDMRVRPLLARPRDVRAVMRSARAGEEDLYDLLKDVATVATDLSITLAVPPETAGSKIVSVDHTASDDGAAVRLLDLTISDAIRRAASDIHFEAEATDLRVRFRIDGMLVDVLRIPIAAHPSLISRLKVIAGLNLIETRIPQDGRLKVSCAGKDYDLRVSTLPSYFGEKAVIRILDASAPTFSLDACGIAPDVLVQWRQLVNRPSGLVLMTGPTGSGKTSTLFAALLELRSPSRNIVTVEDPVEFQFPGIVHVPVRPGIGMTFAAVLRSILRQDPDIILVGEIRDAETAEICLQAAMTGHLVLSSLHTNDAVSAIPRLLDLGVDPSLVATCLIGVMAQRLVRTLCDACATPHRYGVQELSRLGVDRELVANEAVTGRRAAGCPACRGFGYSGRTALVELVRVTREMQTLIATRAPATELRVASRLDGARSLAHAGLMKIRDGVTSVEEVVRVAGPDDIVSQAEQHGSASPASRAGGVSDEPSGSPADPCNACGEPRDARWLLCPYCGEAAPQSTQGTVVIVCDDDPVARRVASRALAPEFTRVIEVSNAREALDRIAVSMPDLLLIDQVMPGLSGVDAIHRLRAELETAALPIVMLTSSTEESTETTSLAAGADDYIQKPVSPARLRARTRAVLAAKRRFSLRI